MKKLFSFILAVMISYGVQAKTLQYDVVVIGGGTSGITAGVQSARLGAKTLIVEETSWLGGMLTSAGVSATDGNFRLQGGMWGEFCDSLLNRYGGKLENLATGWVSSIMFEPSVGNAIFQNIAKKEQNLSIMFNTELLDINKKSNRWNLSVKENGKNVKIKARIVIDATELGDVAKMCGVKYDIGMESRHVTGEEIAPVKSNGIIQDLTYTAVLKDYGRDVTIERPLGYDPKDFACTCINDLCETPTEPDRMWPKDKMITYGKLQNGKYMINWPIEGNDYYCNIIELSKEKRAIELAKAKNHTMCYLYFIQHELGFNTLGLADDEFPTDDLLPLIPYHRESRRIHGKVRFTYNDVTEVYRNDLYRTAIAVGDYPVDQHHMAYTGAEELPNLYFHPIPSYGLPLGTLIPEETENLIVAEKSISVSNIMNGSTRLQPVVLQIGQAAGAIAALSVAKGKKTSDIDVRDVQRTLLENGSYLLPYLDVPRNHKAFKSFQRIGVTGILQGEGRNEGWSNETWLRTNDNLKANELSGFKAFYPAVEITGANKELSVAEAFDLIRKASSQTVSDTEMLNLLKDFDFNIATTDKNITRGAFAILVDKILNPFERKVTIKGNLL